MSIATAITQLNNAKQGIAAAIEAKGVSTTGHGLSDFASDIASIPSGGGGDTTELERIILAIVSGQYDASMPEVLDLSQLSGMTITTIHTSALNSVKFKKIILPDSLTSMGNYAISSCSNLEEVDLGSGLMEIPSSCFSWCTKLKTIDTSNIENVYGSAFQNCYALTSIDLSSLTDTDLATYVFQNCSNLETVLLPSTITTIGNGAFDGCSKFNQWTQIPSNIVSIGTQTFRNTGLTEIEIPSTVTYMGGYAFANCSKLAKLILDTSVSNTYMFQNCTALTKVWISSNCSTLRASTASNGPFNGCNHLTDIYCEPTSQPAGWGSYWNYTASATQATVHYGVSRADFETIVGA